MLPSQAQLAISYALAQSTKLSLHERRVVALVGETRTLPEELAATGHVDLPHGLVARLIGRVFIEKSAVNLLTPVLDTPGGYGSCWEGTCAFPDRCGVAAARRSGKWAVWQVG